MSLPEWIEETSKGLVLHLQIQPKASKTEVVGPHGTPARLKVRVAAPPVEGEANAELIQFLRKKLKLPSSQLGILRGDASKMKDVLCTGIAAFQAVAILWPSAAQQAPSSP